MQNAFESEISDQETFVATMTKKVFGPLPAHKSIRLLGNTTEVSDRSLALPLFSHIDSICNVVLNDAVMMVVEAQSN